MGQPDPPTAQPNPTSPPTRSPRRPVRAEAVALLRMAQAGDREAFGQLYASHARQVRHYVAAWMADRDRDAVPDLVQDTFTAALEELDRAHDDVQGWFPARRQNVHPVFVGTTPIPTGGVDHRRTPALPGSHRRGTGLDLGDQTTDRPGAGRA